MLKELCGLNGISGREDAVREFIISKLPEECKYRVDSLGNLIVQKKGRSTPKNKVMLTAHMDEVGFIITYITDDGFLKFSCVGGIDERVIFGRAVTVGRNGAHGVIGSKAFHQLTSDERMKVPKTDDMYIDIGAKDRKEAEKYVSLGDSAYFDSEYIEFGDGFIKAKALDDRAGCMMLLNLANSDRAYDLTLCFLVQEEIGTRGAVTAAFAEQPDYAIVLESTTANDIPDVPESKKVCKLGGGAVISFMDRGTVYNTELYKKAFCVAKENKIPAQTKTVVAGGNDAAAIHKSRGGVKTVTLSVPTRYIHSPSSVAKAEDIKSVERLAAALAEEFCNA